ncbi:hypothetical protein TNCV_4729191 [Trichonephila clavipes]|nr:hypothetical protein TNCV_4729191 [Trichonephila clavipes]
MCTKHIYRTSKDLMSNADSIPSRLKISNCTAGRETRRLLTFSHFQRIIYDCGRSRDSGIRDLVHDTAEQTYQGGPRTTSSPLLKTKYNNR